VTQAAFPTCDYDLAPSDQGFGAGGGSGIINVGTNLPTCAWTAVSNASWIGVQSGVTGIGNSRVTYSVDSNSGPARAGTITIGRATFTVTQAGQ
jgi:hypothetical protein